MNTDPERCYVKDFVTSLENCCQEFKFDDENDSYLLKQLIQIYKDYLHECPYYFDRRKDNTFEVVCSVTGTPLVPEKHNYVCVDVTFGYLLRICCEPSNRFATNSIRAFFEILRQQVGPFNCHSFSYKDNGQRVSKLDNQPKFLVKGNSDEFNIELICIQLDAKSDRKLTVTCELRQVLYPFKSEFNVPLEKLIMENQELNWIAFMDQVTPDSVCGRFIREYTRKISCIIQIEKKGIQ